MKQTGLRVVVIVVLCMGMLTAVYAQGGGNRPSANGGRYGAPGMPGATGNGSGAFSGSLPSGGGPGTGGTLGGNRPASGSAGGNLGGNRPGSEGMTGGLGGRLGSGGGRPPAISGPLGEGGLGALFGGEGGLAAQFNFSRQEGQSWAEFGGFGLGASGASQPPSDALPNTAELWSSTVDEDMAATLNDALNNAIAAQAEAISQRTEEAQQAAQAAYDQFWEDYYEAIYVAADAYAEAMSEEAEELYQEALVAATTAIDNYEQYADWYASYCYYYPWDCYMYAYDAASAAYEATDSYSDQPLGTVALGAVEAVDAATLATLAAEVFAGSAEAYQAIVVFANDQLGAVVEPLYAGVLTEEIVNYLFYLPSPVAAYTALLADAQAYWGILNGGVAGVAIADCSAAAPCTVTDMALELSDASGGAYALYVAAPMPGDAAGALDLITTVYPALDGLAFSQVTDAEAGLTFLATAYGVGADDSGQPLTVARLVYAGVVGVEGQTVAYALVAVGEAQIQAFNSLFSR